MKKLFAQLCRASRRYFYGSSIRKEVEYVMGQLKEKPSLFDFLASRWTSMDRRETVGVIQKAIDDKIVTWQELNTTTEQINNLYRNQFSSLIELYDLSFSMNHWDSYGHAAKGLRTFYDIAFGLNEDLLDKKNYRSIKRHFSEVIYAFLRTEGPAPEKQILPLGDPEAVLILMNNHWFSEHELWSVRWPSAATRASMSRQTDTPK